MYFLLTTDGIGWGRKFSYKQQGNYVLVWYNVEVKTLLYVNSSQRRFREMF